MENIKYEMDFIWGWAKETTPVNSTRLLMSFSITILLLSVSGILCSYSKNYSQFPSQYDPKTYIQAPVFSISAVSTTSGFSLTHPSFPTYTQNAGGYNGSSTSEVSQYQRNIYPREENFSTGSVSQSFQSPNNSYIANYSAPLVFSRIRGDLRPEFNYKSPLINLPNDCNNQSEKIVSLSLVKFSESFISIVRDALNYSINSEKFLANPRTDNEKLIAKFWKLFRTKSFVIQRICRHSGIFSDIARQRSPVELVIKGIQRIIKKEGEGCEINNYIISRLETTFSSIFSLILKEPVSLSLSNLYLLLAHLFLNYHDLQTLNDSEIGVVNKSDSTVNVASAVIRKISPKMKSISELPSVLDTLVQNEAPISIPSESGNDWDDISFNELAKFQASAEFPEAEFVPELKVILPEQKETAALNYYNCDQPSGYINDEEYLKFLHFPDDSPPTFEKSNSATIEEAYQVPSNLTLPEKEDFNESAIPENPCKYTAQVEPPLDGQRPENMKRKSEFIDIDPVKRVSRYEAGNSGNILRSKNH